MESASEDIWYSDWIQNKLLRKQGKQDDAYAGTSNHIGQECDTVSSFGTFAFVQVHF